MSVEGDLNNNSSRANLTGRMTPFSSSRGNRRWWHNPTFFMRGFQPKSPMIPGKQVAITQNVLVQANTYLRYKRGQGKALYHLRQRKDHPSRAETK